MTLPTSLVGNVYLFTGQTYDAETGNYYYRLRYYSPVTGRFLSQDPAGYINGPNQYQYVGSSPGNYTDPLGLDAANLGIDFSKAQIMAAGMGGPAGPVGDPGNKGKPAGTKSKKIKGAGKSWFRKLMDFTGEAMRYVGPLGYVAQQQVSRAAGLNQQPTGSTVVPA